MKICKFSCLFFALSRYIQKSNWPIRFATTISIELHGRNFGKTYVWVHWMRDGRQIYVRTCGYTAIHFVSSCLIKSITVTVRNRRCLSKRHSVARETRTERVGGSNGGRRTTNRGIPISCHRRGSHPGASAVEKLLVDAERWPQVSAPEGVQELMLYTASPGNSTWHLTSIHEAWGRSVWNRIFIVPAPSGACIHWRLSKLIRQKKLISSNFRILRGTIINVYTIFFLNWLQTTTVHVMGAPS